MNSTQLNEIFTCLDKDKSGYIELDEFKTGIKLIYGIKDNFSDELINDLFTFIDGFGIFNRKDHRLNKDEVRKIWQKIPPNPSKGQQGICELIFDIIDFNGSGFIEESEFKVYMRRVENTKLNSKELNNMFVKMQTDIGKISKEKFVEYLKNELEN